MFLGSSDGKETLYYLQPLVWVNPDNDIWHESVMVRLFGVVLP